MHSQAESYSPDHRGGVIAGKKYQCPVSQRLLYILPGVRKEIESVLHIPEPVVAIAETVKSHKITVRQRRTFIPCATRNCLVHCSIISQQSVCERVIDRWPRHRMTIVDVHSMPEATTGQKCIKECRYPVSLHHETTSLIRINHVLDAGRNLSVQY